MAKIQVTGLDEHRKAQPRLCLLAERVQLAVRELIQQHVSCLAYTEGIDEQLGVGFIH